MDPRELIGPGVDYDYIGVASSEKDGCLTACWSNMGTMVLPKRLITGPGSRHVVTYEAIERLLDDLKGCLGDPICKLKTVAVVVENGVVASQLIGDHRASDPLLKPRADRVLSMKKNFSRLMFFKPNADTEEVVERRVQHYKDTWEDA